VDYRDRPPEDIAQDTLDAIVKRDAPWLLIYDNADDPTVMQNYERDSANLSLIVTSRSTEFDAYLDPIKVDKLDPDDAVEMLDGLFKARGKLIDRQLLEMLAERVGYWPLVLVGAAGYLRVMTKPDVEDYVEKFDVSKVKLKGMGYDDSRASLEAMLRVSTDGLRADDRELLSVLSYLNPDDLWPEMLAEGAGSELETPFDDSHWPDFWQRAGADAALIPQGFDRLAGLSLIAAKDDRWQMHRMTGEIWRAMLEPAEQVDTGNTAARLLNAKMPTKSLHIVILQSSP
jgi:hypothetical protein